MTLTSVTGIHVLGKSAGIKAAGKKDLAVIYSEAPANVAGVFTTNKVKGAPVVLSIERLAKNRKCQAIVINSGNSNVATGEQGMKDAVEMARAAAYELGIDEQYVLVSSTGIIGFPLPMQKIMDGLKGIKKDLSDEYSQTKDAAEDAAQSIMTTDTCTKQIAVKIKGITGTNSIANTITLAAMAKGSGMIHPNMATMLAFIATDAEIGPSLLQKMLKTSVDKSFNMIAVDNDTSTSDSVYLMANGLKGKADEKEFQKALDHVCIELAKMIAKDGEGATKLMEVIVKQAKTFEDAKKVAKSVALSYLTKSAFGIMPIFGRVMAAAGYSGANIEPEKMDVYFGDEMVVNNGIKADYDKQKINKILKCEENNEGKECNKEKKITITINLNQGKETATAWGCDLTKEYVDINAGYYT
ncbi:TPA: bifunctional glutamate N-acetyltransferase/amino-acid acetyltransferase ArgJ [Candidatus Woesearchaeota archaeon]|nr:bifunctional glutamate N-acetyltransferase/amino-acid acetyltransferase ArgJ [Candidatus Woesearchaeota archaeon]